MQLPANVDLAGVRRTFSADELTGLWTVREFTKKDAAETQLDTSVRLFFHGELLSSITLAGAVESSLPNTTDHHFWSILQETGHKHPGVKGTDTRERIKNVADMFNGFRNWLKHDGEESYEIPMEEAILMIVRASTKFEACYGPGSLPESATIFASWLKKVRSDLLEGRTS